MPFRLFRSAKSIMDNMKAQYPMDSLVKRKEGQQPEKKEREEKGK